jgi:hypothetical protein
MRSMNGTKQTHDSLPIRTTTDAPLVILSPLAWTGPPLVVPNQPMQTILGHPPPYFRLLIHPTIQWIGLPGTWISSH